MPAEQPQERVVGQESLTNEKLLPLEDTGLSKVSLKDNWEQEQSLELGLQKPRPAPHCRT